MAEKDKGGKTGDPFTALSDLGTSYVTVLLDTGMSVSGRIIGLNKDEVFLADPTPSETLQTVSLVYLRNVIGFRQLVERPESDDAPAEDGEPSEGDEETSEVNGEN